VTAAARATAVIAAAGSGERLGTGTVKALVEVGGRPLLAWSLRAFAASSVGWAVIAVPQGREGEVADLARRAGDGIEIEVVTGGESRSESVAAAVESVATEVAVIHDAARPLVTAELIDAVVADLLADEQRDCVVAAAPVTDTVKLVVRGSEVDRTLDRSSLWAAQTPQAFRTEALRRALRSTRLLAQATDDAMLLERLGGRVVVHTAPAENLKVTTPLDLRVAELLLAERA
jgi:2-C-methyl-D-erythritol 4-phosphate cytidylyltransferase